MRWGATLAAGAMVVGLAGHAAARPQPQRIVELVNEARREAGLQALQPNERLQQAARLHSQQMAERGTAAHEVAGTTPAQRVRQTGYDFATVGENVAFNQRSAEDVVEGWMSSPGHRANILNEHFTDIGVAVAQDAEGRPYYAQVFATPVARLKEIAERLVFSVRNETAEPLRVQLPGGRTTRVPPRSLGRITLWHLEQEPPEIVLDGALGRTSLVPRPDATYVVREQGVTRR